MLALGIESRSLDGLRSTEVGVFRLVPGINKREYYKLNSLKANTSNCKPI